MHIRGTSHKVLVCRGGFRAFMRFLTTNVQIIFWEENNSIHIYSKQLFKTTHVSIANRSSINPVMYSLEVHLFGLKRRGNKYLKFHLN
jgi:hypothetical protein